MKSYDYDAVAYDGAVYCDDPKCLPEGITSQSEEVSPIFADSEWDSYPVCDTCGAVHDYVGLTEEGQAAESGAEERLDRLIELGFDNSERTGTVIHISCSQCQAMTINGVPCHETGCPNQTAECEECGAVIPKRHRLCESCANPELIEDQDDEDDDD